LKAEGSRIVVVGPVPWWKRGLPQQMLSFYITHRDLLPIRSSSFVSNLWDDEQARSYITSKGAEYVSAWRIFCNVEGCLTRINERSLSALDTVHLTEDGSTFLVDSIAGKLLEVLRSRDDRS